MPMIDTTTLSALLRERYGPRHRNPLQRPIGIADAVTAARRFVLIRHDDPSGVSGTGVVADGIEFADGSVAMRWISDTPSTAIYAAIADVQRIHGHGGTTEIAWIDSEGENRVQAQSTTHQHRQDHTGAGRDLAR
jgi:hypothetical protein